MSSEVPKLKKADLFERVASLNKPFSNDALENPLSAPLMFIEEENPGLAEWAGRVSSNLNQGLGGSKGQLIVDVKVFQNSFIAAYDLISYGYQKNGIDLPTIATPPDHYTWLGFTDNPTIGELFKRYSERQHEASAEYFDYFEALQTWGTERMGFSTPNRVGMTATAGAEVYISFRDHQECSAT